MEYLEYVKLYKRIRKILILGSGAVGKTSLTKVLKSQVPLKDMNGSCDYNRTLFVEIDQFKTENDVGTFQVFDLAGQLSLPIHATRDTARFAFNAVDLICYVFASDNTQSLIELNEWSTIVSNYYKQINSDVPPSILIRNKMDLESLVDNSLLAHIKPTMKAYFEVSCYDGKGINDLKLWFDEFYDECSIIIKE